MFDCIVNAEAPYPRFLSVQGLELIQKVIAAGSQAGPEGCLWLSRLPPREAGGSRAVSGAERPE